ncbi:hypothetical protein AUJ46_04290 [Candidatus Peregrinibacteria bacterium CG1_02_54_53]|nr:MAG: hypothetical protein AUJ46_04290 [Candidatus Peregrinibacteria bacterium CG1_02_54_53]
MSQEKLPFTADSDTFRALQVLWKEEVNEDLTYEKAEEYGPRVLAVVGNVARWKRKKHRKSGEYDE